MTDDDPLDLAEVAADDAELERMRRSLDERTIDLVDAGRDSDPAVLLLRDLLQDVDGDLPEPLPLTAPRGSTVLTIAGERAPRRRRARQGAVVASVTAVVVSFGGIAAASTLVSAATPLHGIGEAVRSAAGAVVGAVSLPDPTPTSPATAAAPAAPAAGSGTDASAAARSQAAARQVGGLLDAAQRLLAAGRPSVASARLDDAERRLAAVAPEDVGDLARRLEQLRADVQAAPPADSAPAAPQAPASKPQKAPAPAPKPAAPQQAPQQQAPQQQAPREQAPQKQQAPQEQRSPQERPQQEPGERETSAPSLAEQEVPARVPDGARGVRGASRAPVPQSAEAQSSSDASTNPRA